jgi:hypothetical protein
VADFAFGGATANDTATVPFPVSLERKRIGDIVNRSTKKDHWYQLQRMQDEAMATLGGVSILLLEGGPRTTEKFMPYGAQAVDTASPYVHTIDDEETLYRYMGRAILNGTLQQQWLVEAFRFSHSTLDAACVLLDPSHTTRFIQTKDEQGTLRMVGVLGLLSIIHEPSDCT